MIRYRDHDFSRWLPIGRYEDRFGFIGHRIGVMEVIKGILAATKPVRLRWSYFVADDTVTKSC